MCLKDSIDRNHFITFLDLCPNGFVVHKNYCYYMKSISTSSWVAARSLYQNMGADLVVIKSEEESQFVNKLMNKSGSDRSGYSGTLTTTSCIGLMAALHIVLTSLIPTGTANNLIIIKIKRAVERFIWVMENGMTEFVFYD